jgi:diketogulonate reductase-like aldo/keto reductase
MITVTLNDGRLVPAVGFGTYQLAPGRPTREAVAVALDAGYRHIDTATVYGNEADVGAVIRESGLPRDEVWVTTKLWNDDHGGERPLRALEASLRRLGLAYVDLWLMHWPVAERLASWRTMVRAREAGLARSIGVSNFLAPHLAELLVDSDAVPAVDQIELSPFLFGTRADTVAYATQRDIAIEAYSPLTKGMRLADPTLGAIATRHGVSPAQVLLRWSLQRGWIPLPRSSNPARIRANLAVESFTLDESEMTALDALNEGLTTGWDPARVPS